MGQEATMQARVRLASGYSELLRWGARGLARASIVLGLVAVGCGSESSAIEEPAQDGGPARQTPDLESAPEFVPMEVIVKFRKNAKEVTSTALANVAKVEALALDMTLVHFDAAGYSVKVDPVETTWALIEELRARDDVEYAHPNWLLQLSRVPNDPLYPNQWHFPAIQLPAAWDLTTGSPSTRIAILDTGRTTHPELAARWVPGLEYDAIAEDGNAATDPNVTWRHGIHVAGIAGGASDNSQGSAGVCWGCQLLNVNVARNVTINGQTTVRVDTAAAIRGISWAVENGAQVINMSFETNGLPCSHATMSGWRNAVAFAIGRNVAVVAAAGNQGANAANTVPASCSGVIAVAATDRNNALASYSNYGAVTLAAPGGGGVLTTGGDGYGAGVGCPPDPASGFTPFDPGALSTWTTSNHGQCYRYLSGTSMAAPHVAGVVGLMLSRNPSLSPARVKEILQITAQQIKCTGECGAGLLNALGAVQQAAALPINDAPPVARFTVQCSGLDCTFDGRSSTDDRGIVSYQWSFPGQQTRVGATTSFFMPGYAGQTVRLRVTDTAGQSAEIAQTVSPAQPFVTPMPGAYYNSQRSGNGIDLFETTTGGLHVTWYTYEVGGTPVWYTSGHGLKIGARWSQPLYRATWNGSSASLTQVGTVSLDFSSSTAAWFSWVLNGVPGGERFVYLAGGQGRSGAWYVPSQSGWGIQVQESGTFLGVTVAFYHQGQPRWMQGAAAAPGPNVTIPLTYYQGPGLCPSCGGSTRPTADPSFGGSINLQILNGASTTGLASTDITVSATFPIWVRPLQTIQLLTKP
jgi:subtilisin family serine protease